MLHIKIVPDEYWDEKKEEFVTVGKEQELQLEHSLVSISKWEMKYHKPFLTKEPKTDEEMIDYIKCMTMTQNVDPEVYKHLSNNVLKQINDYIADSMTATTFSQQNNQPTREIITSELVYYWMIASNIPMECQKWHINRLLTLIRVCSIKNAPPKKMGKRELASQYASLNAARRQRFNSRG